MILVFNRHNLSFTKPKCILKNVVDLQTNKVLGGEHSISFAIPITAFNGTIQVEDFVEYRSVRYIIKRFAKERTDKGLLIRVEAVGLYEMLLDYVIEGQDTWLPGVNMSEAINRALRSTPFRLARCDNAGLWDIELSEMNVLEAINRILSSWPKRLEIYFDNFDVYIVEMQGTDTGTHLTYHKNLGTITKSVDSSNVVTRLKGRGRDGLTVEGFNVSGIPEADRTGFVIENGVVVKDYIQTGTFSQYAYPKTAIEQWSNITDQKTLFYKLIDHAKEVFIPKTVYEASYVELQRQGVSHTSISLGDWVRVLDKDLGIGESLRVVELNEHPFKHEASTAVLAVRESNMVDFMAELKDTKTLIRDINEDIRSHFSELEIAIAESTKLINAGDSTVLITENDGILVIKRDTLGPNGEIMNTTQFIKLANGAIGCTVDGGLSYRSAMTPYGINADTITTGIVRAQHLAIGSLSDFEDGYNPYEIDNALRDALSASAATLGKAIDNNMDSLRNVETALNNSIQETNTAQNMLKTDLQDKISALNLDVSGLQGSTNSLAEVLANVEKELTGNSYFTFTSSGIRATDTVDTRNRMWLNSNGLALSTNNGVTWNNAITAKGIVASQVTIGTFSQNPFKGLIITNKNGQETFAIDTNGNMSMMGNINMLGGSIAWQNVSKMPFDALDSKFKNMFTYIDSNGIYTKTIEANQLNAKGLHIKNNSGQTTFQIDTLGRVTINGTVIMGSGSSINWSQVNAPTASQVGARADNWMPTKNQLGNWTTYIDSDGIYTGTIRANKILVGGTHGSFNYNDLINRPSIPTNSDITTITQNYVRTASVYAQNLEVQSANIRGTISANKISVGGTHGALSYSDLSNKPSIPTNSDITTITGNYVSTANLYAQNLKVNSANIQGNITATNMNTTNSITIGNFLNMNAQSFGGGIRWSGVAEIYIDPMGKNLIMSGSSATTLGSWSGTTYINGDVKFGKNPDIGNGYTKSSSSQAIFFQVWNGKLEFKLGASGVWKVIQST